MKSIFGITILNASISVIGHQLLFWFECCSSQNSLQMLCIHIFCVLSLLVGHFDGSEHPALQIVWIDNATRCRNSLLALFVHSLTDARLHLTGVDWPCHFGDAVQRCSWGLWFVTGRKKHLRLRRRTVIRSERPIDGLWVKAWIKARRRPFKTSFYTKNTYTQTHKQTQEDSTEKTKR